MGLRDMYRAGDIIEYEGGGRDYLVSIEGEEGLWVNACNSTWIEQGLRDFCDQKAGYLFAGLLGGAGCAILASLCNIDAPYER